MTTPAPLTDLDLRHVPAMLLDVARFRDSDLAGEDPIIIGVNLMLWACSWHQAPCASIPNDDKLLARYTGFGRDLDGWLAIRDRVLNHGWVLCSDNRLYHRVVAEKAIEIADGGKVRSRKAKHAAATRWAKQSSEHATSMPAASIEHLPSNARRTTQASDEHDPSNAASNAKAMLGDANLKESKVRERKVTEKEVSASADAAAVRPKHLEPPKDDPKLVQLTVDIRAAYEHANVQGTPDTAIVFEWAKSIPHFDIELTLACIRYQASKLKGKFKPLAVFEPRLREKHEERYPAAAAPPPSQVADTEESSENETGHKGLSPAAARVALKYWEEKHQWMEVNGPRPHEMGCRIPSHILREHGYRDEHGRRPSPELATSYGKLLTHVTKGRETARNSLTPIMKNGGAHTETVQ